MSAQFFAHIKTLEHRLTELTATVAAMSRRVAALEPQPRPLTFTAPAEEQPKRRGRPPKGE